MIIESLCMVARRERREELQAGLSFLLGPMRVESGCISCHLYLDVTNPNAFHFECLWKTEADFVRHLRTENYRQFLILTELGAEPPSIQFHTVSATRGLEWVRATRQQESARESDDMHLE